MFSSLKDLLMLKFLQNKENCMYQQRLPGGSEGRQSADIQLPRLDGEHRPGDGCRGSRPAEKEIRRAIEHNNRYENR